MTRRGLFAALAMLCCSARLQTVDDPWHCSPPGMMVLDYHTGAIWACLMGDPFKPGPEFIIVDREVMRVLEWSPSRHIMTVERGVLRTRLEPHKAGALVMRLPNTFRAEVATSTLY